jgi:DNA-binding transcriptional LysR family regulator
MALTIIPTGVAAQKLYVAQPAISMSIKQLEDETGLQLIDRKAKNVRATPEGEIFIQHASEVLDKLDNLNNAVDDMLGLTKGTVSLAIPEMIGNYYMADAIAGFKKLYPDISMVITTHPADTIKNLISSDDADMGIIAIDNLSDSYESISLFREEIVIGASRQIPISNKKSINIKELADMNMLIFGSGNHHVQKLLFSIMEANGIKPNVVFESNLTDVIKQLTIEDVGVSAYLKKVIVNDERISKVSLEPNLYTEVGLVWKKGSYLSRANRLFSDHIKNKFGGA